MNKICLTIFLFLFSINIYADGFILSSIVEAEKLSKQTKQPILIIFGDENCEFCKALLSDISVNKLNPEIDKYIICYIDINENKDYKNKYNISMIPDSRIMQDKRQVSKMVGYTKEKYKNWIKNVNK